MTAETRKCLMERVMEAVGDHYDRNLKLRLLRAFQSLARGDGEKLAVAILFGDADAALAAADEVHDRLVGSEEFIGREELIRMLREAEYCGCAEAGGYCRECGVIAGDVHGYNCKMAVAIDADRRYPPGPVPARG